MLYNDFIKTILKAIEDFEEEQAKAARRKMEVTYYIEYHPVKITPAEERQALKRRGNVVVWSKSRI